MHITGHDYSDDELIAPWDPARRRQRQHSRRDDPDRDDARVERDDVIYDEVDPTAVESKP